MILKRCSGVLLHPTSFPGKYGIGDLGDAAYEFIDFLGDAGQSLWQILPLCPTSFGDSPYQSFSTFASNHLLISPDVLLEKGWLENEDLQDIPCFDPIKIDYGPLINFKNSLLQKAYNNFKQNMTKSTKTDFDNYCTANKGWLDDYTLFVSLKNHFIEERTKAGYTDEFYDFEEKISPYMKGDLVKDYYFGAVWSTWPEDIAKRKLKAIKYWTYKLSDTIQFNKFLQFEISNQWIKLKNYANENNIQIIGDIPIFVAFDSSDTWANPELFYLDETGYPTDVAGVPPDYFSETGQLWGNPLYKWDVHKKTGYSWWIERIKSVLNIVDIVRIDHFRGFQAFWAVPFGSETAIEGEWRKGPGKDLFMQIEKTLGELPIIAEDLGLITKDVKELRDCFNLPGMRVLQFAFGSGAGNAYLPHNFSPNCIVYTGTHDNDTSIGWYSSASEKEKDYIRRYLNIDGSKIGWDLIRLAYSSSANFAIAPLQDVLSLDSSARMNTPGITGTSWQWRYTSDMLSHNLASELKYISELFGRCDVEDEEEVEIEVVD